MAWRSSCADHRWLLTYSWGCRLCALLGFFNIVAYLRNLPFLWDHVTFPLSIEVDATSLAQAQHGHNDTEAAVQELSSQARGMTPSPGPGDVMSRSFGTARRDSMEDEKGLRRALALAGAPGLNLPPTAPSVIPRVFVFVCVVLITAHHNNVVVRKRRLIMLIVHVPLCVSHSHRLLSPVQRVRPVKGQ